MFGTCPVHMEGGGGYLIWPSPGGRRSTPSSLHPEGGGVPPSQGRYPPVQGKYPPSRVGTPPPPRVRNPLSKVGIPHPKRETEQHSEYLLQGRRYASCVHAGGLSCNGKIFFRDKCKSLNWVSMVFVLLFTCCTHMGAQRNILFRSLDYNELKGVQCTIPVFVGLLLATSSQNPSFFVFYDHFSLLSWVDPIFPDALSAIL